MLPISKKPYLKQRLQTIQYNVHFNRKLKQTLHFVSQIHRTKFVSLIYTGLSSLRSADSDEDLKNSLLSQFVHVLEGF